MKTSFLSIALLGLGLTSAAQTTMPSSSVQIQTALLAAPIDKRDDASVYGYTEKGDFILLKQGKNEMICLADDPKIPGLSVACYHKDLEPFFFAKNNDLTIFRTGHRKSGVNMLGADCRRRTGW